MKIIKQFIFKPDRGFYIDLEDAPFATIVTAIGGDILLHEGGYDHDRIGHGASPGHAVDRFEVESVNGMVGIRVWFKARGGMRTHLLGFTEDIDSAEKWVTAVNAIYENRQAE